MSKAVRSAIMKVQVLTNLRGMYLQSSSDKIVSGELGIETAGELETLRTYGSNVQFVFREENFG